MKSLAAMHQSCLCLQGSKSMQQVFSFRYLILKTYAQSTWNYAKYFIRKCFKKRAQQLTDANTILQLVCAKQLLKNYRRHSVDYMWYTDEQVFTVECPVNSQNDHVYCNKKKKQIPAERLLHTRSTFSKSLMVSVAVSYLWCRDLILIESGVKVNGQYYRDVILQQNMLPTIRRMSGDIFTFQQDNAPWHRAWETVELLAQETPDFIRPSQWPANSPELNCVDYAICGKLQDRDYRCSVHDLDH